MSQSSLSIVIANYNHARFIPEMLQSLLEQSYQPVEIIVIDDASTDNSVDVIEKFAKENSIIHFMKNEHNQGVEYSFNKGLQAASGNYVALFSADDICLPTFLEKSMNLLKKFPQAGLCCSDPVFLDDHTGDIRKSGLRWSNKPSYLSPDKLSKVILGKYIPGHTAIMKRSALLEAGGYISDLKWHCDWFATLVLGFRYGICYIPESLAVLRLARGSYSASGRRVWRTQREVLDSLLNLLWSDKFQDVFPLFLRSGVLSHFSIGILRLVFEDQKLHSPIGFKLIRSILLSEFKKLFYRSPLFYIRWINRRIRYRVKR